MSSLSSSSEKLRRALEELKLSKYWEQFLSEEIDAAALCCISSEEELGHLGVDQGDRAPLMKWINDTLSGAVERSTPSPGTRSGSGAAAEAAATHVSSSSSSFSSESSPTSSPSLNSTMNPSAREFKPPTMSLAPPPMEYAPQAPSPNAAGFNTATILAPVHNMTSSLDGYYGIGGGVGGMQYGSGVVPMGGLHYEHGFNPYQAEMNMMMTQQQPGGGGGRRKKNNRNSRRRAQEYSTSRGGGGRRNQDDLMSQMNTYDSRGPSNYQPPPQDHADRRASYSSSSSSSNNNNNNTNNNNRSFRGEWSCPDDLNAAGSRRGSREVDNYRQYPENNDNTDNNSNSRHNGPSYETPPREFDYADESPRPVHEQRRGANNSNEQRGSSVISGNTDPASLADGSPSSVAGDTDPPPNGRKTATSEGGGGRGVANAPRPVTDSEARNVALSLGLPDNKESITTVQTLLALQAQALKKQQDEDVQALKATDDVRNLPTPTMRGDAAGASMDAAGRSTAHTTHQKQRQPSHVAAVAPLDDVNGGARAGHTGRSAPPLMGQQRGDGGGGGGTGNGGNNRRPQLPPPTIETIVPLFATVDYEQLSPAACEVVQAASDARREELYSDKEWPPVVDKEWPPVDAADGGSSDGGRGRGAHGAQDPHRNLYVANFGDVLGERDIEQLFGCFAEVRRVVMKDVIDKPTGDVKGIYAFVWTGSIDQSSRARLALHNTKLKNGRKLQVKFAKEGSFKITSLTVTTDGDGNHRKEFVTLRADERKDSGDLQDDARSSDGGSVDYYDQRQPSYSRLGGGGGGGGGQGGRTEGSDDHRRQQAHAPSSEDGQFRGRGGLFPRGSYSSSGDRDDELSLGPIIGGARPQRSAARSGESSSALASSGNSGVGGGKNSLASHGGGAKGAPQSAAVLALRQQYGTAGNAAGRRARAPPPPPPGFKGGAKNAQTVSWKPASSSYQPQTQPQQPQPQYPSLTLGTLNPWDHNATAFH